MEDKLSFPLGNPTPSQSHLVYCSQTQHKKWLTDEDVVCKGVVCLHCFLLSSCSLRQTAPFSLTTHTLVSLNLPLPLPLPLSLHSTRGHPRSSASVNVIWYQCVSEHRALGRTKEEQTGVLRPSRGQQVHVCVYVV